MEKPDLRPQRPFFASGPCAKRPGWTFSSLDQALIARSHRSKPGKERLLRVIEESQEILGIPKDWRIGIVPASDTGAVEMALWSLLGPRPVDVLSFDSFSAEWAKDIAHELKLRPRLLSAPYGSLPDLTQIDWSHDVVLAWNGTSSGVKIPDGSIPANHEGLIICDATSAIFAMPLPWDRLDVVTWSWQKALGGEAGHGMIALSPAALQRLKEHEPTWPVPKIFRLAKEKKLIEGIFKGETINTPSLLAVEDQLDGLNWARSLGGAPALVRRTRNNFFTIAAWVERSDWAGFLAQDEKTRSPTSVCLIFRHSLLATEPPQIQTKVANAIVAFLEQEKIAFDIGSYRDAPPGLRIWCGPTQEAADIAKLLPWLDWAFTNALRQWIEEKT